MWSPWRAAWVAKNSAAERSNIFVDMLAEDADEKNLILWRGRLMFVVMNLYPYNNGHVLIVPNRKVENYSDLTPDEMKELSVVLGQVLSWIDRALKPDGYNIGMNLGKAGGAGIPQHLHLHVVPRWSSDTSFMSTTSNVRVLPETLRDTYDRIRSVISETT
jgi:ATP adenylyltransferase